MQFFTAGQAGNDANRNLTAATGQDTHLQQDVTFFTINTFESGVISQSSATRIRGANQQQLRQITGANEQEAQASEASVFSIFLCRSICSMFDMMLVFFPKIWKRLIGHRQ